jgi:hypothetical protein
MKSLLLVLTLLCPVLTHAANQAADYSGSWAMDKARSTGLPAVYDKVKRHTLLNTQTSTQLGVLVEVDIGQPDTDKIDFAYPLDGTLANTQSKIRTRDGLVNVPTTLQALVGADGSIHIDIVRTIPMGDKTITSRATEDWQLSADGKTLNIHRTDESPRGKNQSDMVFIKS